MKLHHVQVACPPGGEDVARRFYRDELGERLSGLGFDVDWRERYSFEGYERLHTRDGHGNRVEILAPL